MLPINKFFGIVIVFIGALFGLAALIGFSIDRDALLAAVKAPLFESALQVLLSSHRLIFIVASFVLVFFILVCSVISFGKGTTHVGFTILIASLLAGLASWPHGTPFMLITMLGAHWIALTEAQSAEQPAGAEKTDPAPPHRQRRGAKGNAPVAQTPPSQPDPEDTDPPPVSISKPASRMRSVFRRFFH